MDQLFNEPEIPKNRLMDAISLYAEQEARYKMSNPIARKDDMEALQLKKTFYDNVYQRYKNSFKNRKINGKLSNEEKETLSYISQQRFLLEAKIRPTLLKSVSVVFIKIGNALNPTGHVHEIHNKNLQSIRQTHTDNANLDNLQLQLRQAGFNVSMEGPLKKMIDHNLNEFHLRHSEPGLKNTDYVLHFKKLPGTDYYYFEKYDATARQTALSFLQKEDPGMRQTFAQQDKYQFSAKEAANLVNNLPVQKVFDGEEKWVYLNKSAQAARTPTFNTVFFDLDKQLAKWPIKELESPAQKQKLLHALRQGEVMPITLKTPQGNVEYKVKVNAQSGTLRFSDKMGNQVDLTAKLNPTQQEKTKKLYQRMTTVEETPVIKMGNHKIRS